MHGRFRLPLEIRFRQPQRLEFPHAFGVHRNLAAARLPPLGLQFFHPLLDASLSVYQSFSGITHMPMTD
jgi:hypothetical protein